MGWYDTLPPQLLVAYAAEVTGRILIMRILVTGFEPFGNDVENASWEAVSRLPSQIETTGSNVEIFRRMLPVEFNHGREKLREFIVDTRPDAVVCVGEAGRRVDITPETTAVNSARAAIADNSGYLATGEALDAGTVIDSRLPNEHIANTLADAGYPVSLSHDAGQYVCNAVFRASLTHFAGVCRFHSCTSCA